MIVVWTIGDVLTAVFVGLCALLVAFIKTVEWWERRKR